jgi:DNA-binding NarL/FixJ family response regulator
VFPSVDDTLQAYALFTPEPELARQFKSSLGRETFDTILGQWQRPEREEPIPDIPDLHEEFRLYPGQEAEDELIATIDIKNRFAELTPKEQIIAQALEKGGPPEEIAKKLGITDGDLRVAKSRIKKILMG